MVWQKLGRIYNPNEEMIKAVGGGYGANPVAVNLENNDFRIFFNYRDENNRSNVTFLDYDLIAGKVISNPHQTILSPGEPGTFDDSGCSLGAIIDMGDSFYIYYLGWNLLKLVPWVNTIGLAVYDKKSGVCKKISKAPILNRSDEDPLTISYPFVRKEGNTFRMWYGSHLSWGTRMERPYDFTHVLKYAESDDGIHFHRTGKICIQGKDKSEYAFARPSVLFENGIYKMWYTFRGEKYRIGYAESSDGINWSRMDSKVNILPSTEEWESEEVSYPYVFLHKNIHYMLYCGNGYGKTGFGIAVEK